MKALSQIPQEVKERAFVVLGGEVSVRKINSVVSATNVRREKGVSLLEVIVALAMIALVLVSAVSTQIIAARVQMESKDRVSGVSVLRHLGMAYMADNPESKTNAGSSMQVESGNPFVASQTGDKQQTLGFIRKNFDISVSETTNGTETINLFFSRVQIVEKISTGYGYPGDADEGLESSLYLLTASTDSKGLTYGDIRIGSGTYGDFATNEASYGANVSLEARPAGGYRFIRWEEGSSTNPSLYPKGLSKPTNFHVSTNNPATNNPVEIVVNGDLEFRAVFGL